MSHGYLPPLLLLLMVTLVRAGGSRPPAPGDEDDNCTGTFPAVPNTIRLLDTRSYTDLGRTLFLAARWNDSGSACALVLHACTTTTEEAVLRTQPIRFGGVAPEAVEITIEIEFSFNDSSPGCVGSLQFFTDTSTAPDMAIMPPITCGDTSPQTRYFPVSNLGGTDPFFLILRALANMDAAFCVDVTRFRVHVQQCVEDENEQASYGEGLSGQTVTGVCVANSEVSAGSSLNATCGRDGLYDFGSAGGCECVAGYQPDGDECQACLANTFKPSPGNDNCMPCPANSTAASTGSVECACVPNYVRSNSGDVTTACDVCAMGSFRDGASCVTCPAGSSTTTLDAAECDCDGDSTTSGGSRTTTGDPCGGSDCSSGFFFINGRCEPCPYQSDTSGTGATECVCNSGYVDGTATTTTTGCTVCAGDFYQSGTAGGGEPICSACPTNSQRDIALPAADGCPCNSGFDRADRGDLSLGCIVCAEDFYQTGTAGGGEALCSACPANSERDIALPASDGCPCITGFGRTDETDLSLGCIVQYGFTSQELTVAESASGVLTVELGASIAQTVTITVQEDSPIGVAVVPSTLTFMPGNPIMQTITITVDDDDVALEPDVSFSLSLQTSDAILGGGRYGTVQVTVTDDDDTVTVGFISSSVSFNESDGQVSVVVGKSAEIGSDLMLTVTGSIGGNSVSENVVFTPGPNNRETVSLSIPNDETDNENVVSNLMLQLGSPNDRVTIGDGGAYFSTIAVTVVDDDPAEPSEGLATGAIIGIAAGAAGGAVVAACLCLICVLVCRFRVNRQGYYATYEDKAAEPSMIRYSASLRSISSQTVVPAEGKAAVPTKENEFYV